MISGLILAAGEAERHNGGNKPLLIVNCETLLDRTVRLFRKHCSKLTIVTHRADIAHPGCEYLMPSNRERVTNTLLSTRSLWSDEMTLVLLGDVYYGDGAPQTMLSSARGAEAFGEGCNIHGLTILAGANSYLAERLEQFCELVKKTPHKYGFGKLYAFVDWAAIPRRPIDAVDIDSPQQHKRLIEKYGNGTTTTTTSTR